MVTYITELRIGRNIDGKPMGTISWLHFIQKAESLLAQCGSKESRVENHKGTGSWLNDEGDWEYEESAVVTLYDTTPLDSSLRTGLEQDAARLAEGYQQEAIAVVYGESSLVRATVKGSTVR
jgi:hypothetical protein